MTAMRQESSSKTLPQAADDIETVAAGPEGSQQPLLDSHFQPILSSGQAETERSCSLGSWAVLSQSQGLTPPLGGRVLPYPGDLGQAPTFSPSPTSRHRQPLRLHGCNPTPCYQGTVSDSAGHMIHSAPVQPQHAIQTRMLGGCNASPGAAPQELAQQLTGTDDRPWRPHRNGKVDPGSGPKLDADSIATDTRVHAVRPTLMGESPGLPAEDQCNGQTDEGRQTAREEFTVKAAPCTVSLHSAQVMSYCP